MRTRDTNAVWGMWANTGDVDPVLAETAVTDRMHASGLTVLDGGRQ